MQIDRLSINNFGKFSKKEMDFSSGLNVVYGPNESGKTTIQMFIKSMLYNMNKKEEKKYLPWDSENFGAANILNYQLDNGERYLVEKNLNRKTTCIYTLEPYEEVTALFPVYRGNVLFMEEQTGINLTAFESSIFIRQMEMKMNPRGSKDIVERLVRLTHYGDENIDYNNGIKRLEDLKDSIGTGVAGKHKKLIQANQLVNQLQIRLENATNQTNRIKEVEQKYEELKKDKEYLYNEIHELGLIQYYKKSSLIQHYEELKRKIEQAGQIQEELESKLILYKDIAHITQEDMDKLEEYIQKLGLIDEQIKILREKLDRYIIERQKTYDDIKNGVRNIGQLDIRIELLGDKINQLKNRLKIGKTTASIISLLSGIGGLLLGGIQPFWYSLFLFIPLVILLFLNYSRGINSRIQQLGLKQKELEQSIENDENIKVLERLIREIGQEEGEAQQKRKHILIGIKDKLKRLEIRYEDEFNHRNLLDELKIRIREYLELLDRIQSNKRDIATMDENLQMAKNAFLDSREEAQEVVEKDLYRSLADKYGIDETMTSVQMDEIIEEKKLELKNIEMTISSLEKDLEFLYKEYMHPGDIEEQLSSALQDKKEYEDTREAIDIAKYYMEKSLKQVQQNYTPTLNQYTGDILKEITDKKYYDVDTSSDLDVLIRDIDNGLLEPEALSNGTIDQIYFALRLAVTRMLSSEERIPLIIDEPFAKFDDARLKNALSFILKISQERQVLLFTCHKRELDILDTFGKEYHLIHL